MYCESAKLLTQELRNRNINCVRVFPDRNYWPKTNDLVINWGCSTQPAWKNPQQKQFTLLNAWDKVPNAINKIHSFARFKAGQVRCPEVTVDRQAALGWLEAGKSVLGRSSITGRAGQGIVVMEKPDQFVNCPLYSIYKPKRKEFRVHVFDGKVIDVQEKRRKKGFNGKPNPLIRTHDNGWVFCHDGVMLPADAGELAIKAVQVLGLQFGGVDVIWNEKENKSYVLEVNSAPGIEGTTVTRYADAIVEYLNKV